MDTDYRNRASWLIERELGDNLSTDAELGVYLLGTSELLLFNHRLDEANAYNLRRLRLEDESLAPTYFYMHYAVLLMWIYFQEAILRASSGSGARTRTPVARSRQFSRGIR